MSSGLCSRIRSLSLPTPLAGIHNYRALNLFTFLHSLLGIRIPGCSFDGSSINYNLSIFNLSRFPKFCHLVSMLELIFSTLFLLYSIFLDFNRCSDAFIYFWIYWQTRVGGIISVVKQPRIALVWLRMDAICWCRLQE